MWFKRKLNDRLLKLEQDNLNKSKKIQELETLRHYDNKRLDNALEHLANYVVFMESVIEEFSKKNELFIKVEDFLNKCHNPGNGPNTTA